METHVYDLGGASGLLGVLLSILRPRQDLKVTYHHVDSDSMTREVAEPLCLLINANAPCWTWSPEKNSFAQNVEFEENSIVVANDFYEHVTSEVGNEILQKLVKCKPQLHIAHIPIEKVADPWWGHVRAFPTTQAVQAWFESQLVRGRVSILSDGEDACLVSITEW